MNRYALRVRCVECGDARTTSRNGQEPPEYVEENCLRCKSLQRHEVIQYTQSS